MLGFDPLYFILIAPAFLFSIIASFMVKSSFNKYSKVATLNGMSGADAAAAVLRAGAVTDVRIERVDGFLSDHYDPAQKVLRLSPSVYDSRSIAAVGVGAHEAGHAIQHKNKYPMLMFRTSMVPMASIGSNLSWFILFAGFIFHLTNLVYVGIFLFGAVVVFQLITLPVEINASARAKQLLWDTGIISSTSEKNGVAAVLNSAALTYVAAAVSAVLTLIYYLIRAGILGGSSNDR
ncbi:MAG: zinc metallopeptidase [Spirochaetia bacterium]|nr:zinc metallopeptidase [Spirochaetia bacterium]